MSDKSSSSLLLTLLTTPRAGPGALLFTTPSPIIALYGSQPTTLEALDATGVYATPYSLGGTSAGTTIRTPSTSDHILLGICFIVGVLGIVGNTVMVTSILAVRSFRQASNIFFFHHGLLEIAKSALIIPYALSITGKRASYCELLGAMQCVLVTTTSLNLAAITINESFIISHALPGANNIEDASRSSKNRTNNNNNNNKSKTQNHDGSKKGANEQTRLNSNSTKGPSKSSGASSNIKIIPALETGAFSKPSLKRNITCVIFGVLLIWMASLVLNMGVSLITGSGQYNEKIGLCYFVYGHQKSYVVNVMWIVVTSLGVGATIGCLRKLKMDLRRAQEYLMRTFSSTGIRSNYNSTDQRQSNLRSTKSLPHLRQIQASISSVNNGTHDNLSSSKSNINDDKRSSANKANGTKMPRSTTIDERHQQRMSAMMSKQAFQQTRLLNCQFNVIVLQTISFIVFWYPLFGLIIADKDFIVDTEIYKALTVLAWLNAPLTPVFFTYFNYECYSTQVAVRLSVVGNATAQIVRDQAIIAEKMGKSSDDDTTADERGRSAAAKERQAQQAASMNAKRLPPNYSARRINVPPNVGNAPPPPIRSAQRQSKSFYYEPHSTSFRPAVQPYMGRSLQDNVNNLQDETEEDSYWFERRDISANSLHRIVRPGYDNGMVRTETFPKLQFDDSCLEQATLTRPARSLKEIRDFRIAANQYAARQSRPPPPPPLTPMEQQMMVSQANRPHSYENISRYNFESTKRSRTTYPDDDDQDSDEMIEAGRRGERTPVTGWTGAASRSKQQMQRLDDYEQQKLCSWREIARHQVGGVAPTTPQQQPAQETPRSRQSVTRKSSRRPRKSHSRSSSDDEDDDVPPPKPVPKMPPKAILRTSKQNSQQPQVKKHVTQQASITVTSSTDQDVMTAPVQSPRYATQPPKTLTTSGFKNPLYIEAFRRANLRSQQAVVAGTSDEDAIPMTDMRPPEKTPESYRSSQQRDTAPQLRFVRTQGSWNKSVNDTEDEILNAAAGMVSQQTTPNSVTIRQLSITSQRQPQQQQSRDNDADEEEDDDRYNPDALEQVTPVQLEPNVGIDEISGAELLGKVTPVTGSVTSPAIEYTRIESHVKTSQGSVDRLQIWLGKLDPSSSSTAMSPTSQTQPTAAPPQPQPRESRRTGVSLIDEFQQSKYPSQQQSLPNRPDSSSTGAGSPKSEQRKLRAATTLQSNPSTAKSEKSSSSEQREIWI